MIEAYLFRDVKSRRHTLGVFAIRGKLLQTIEPPWRNNRANVSCIPPGRYLCRYLAQSASGKYKDCYHVTNVNGRGAILIHNGNTAEHTRGCVILGQKRGFLGKARAVLSSRLAMRQLVELTDKQDFYLTVIGGN